MSHSLKDCELNHAGVCIFCGKWQDKKAWLARKGGKFLPSKTNEKRNNDE